MIIMMVIVMVNVIVTAIVIAVVIMMAMVFMIGKVIVIDDQSTFLKFGCQLIQILPTSRVLKGVIFKQC